MEMREETRQRRGRRWVAAAALACAAAGLGTFARSGAAGDRPLDELPGHDAPSQVVLAPPGEPGEPLVVSGQVFAPDGETPVPGVVLYVYQTGADGRYAPPGERVPRLRGWVRTDPEGRYEYRTVRPGSYPGGSTPAHIHALLWGAGYEPQMAQDLRFADDPLLQSLRRWSSDLAGRFAHVCSPTRGQQGELRCTRNYRLERAGDRIPADLEHAFEAASGGARGDSTQSSGPAWASRAAAAEVIPHAGRYRVRASDSFVGYRIAKFGLLPVRGHFGGASGEIVIDPTHPERSRASIRVPVASLESGNEARTATLLSDDFFAAGRHPEMAFVSRRAEHLGAGEWRIEGELTIRGVSMPVRIPVRVRRGEGMEGPVVVFSSELEIDRTRFGVLGARWSAGRRVLGETVAIELALAAEPVERG